MEMSPLHHSDAPLHDFFHHWDWPSDPEQLLRLAIIFVGVVAICWLVHTLLESFKDQAVVTPRTAEWKKLKKKRDENAASIQAEIDAHNARYWAQRAEVEDSHG